jgi:hypothetical protein
MYNYFASHPGVDRATIRVSACCSELVCVSAAIAHIAAVEQTAIAGDCVSHSVFICPLNCGVYGNSN